MSKRSFRRSIMLFNHFHSTNAVRFNSFWPYFKHTIPYQIGRFKIRDCERKFYLSAFAIYAIITIYEICFSNYGSNGWQFFPLQLFLRHFSGVKRAWRQAKNRNQKNSSIGELVITRNYRTLVCDINSQLIHHNYYWVNWRGLYRGKPTNRSTSL